MAANQSNDTVFHTHECNGLRFVLPTRYENPFIAGRGASSIVIRARDTILQKNVAIKKTLKPFEDSAYARRTYRELASLTCLNHPSAGIIQLYNVFTPDQSVENFQNLYLVFNYADCNLDEVIRKKKVLKEDFIRHIIYSILVGLKYMHSANVIHRDLKPVNIGLNKNSDVFILDLGLARVLSRGIQTGYVVTRWWRAPEIYINWEHYDNKLDIWSVGCIMAELTLLQPIFCGRDHIDQLNKIFDVIGTPPPNVVNSICTADTAEYINGLERVDKADYQGLFGYKYNKLTSSEPISGLSPAGIDLLDKLLQFDHRERLTAEQALAHPFFNGLREPKYEPTANRLYDDHADATYDISQWKNIIWQMVQEFRPPSWIMNDSSE